MRIWTKVVVLSVVMLLTAGVGVALALDLRPVYVRTIGSGPGIADGQLRWPRGMAIDETAGLLYVAESGNNRVQKFDLESGGPDAPPILGFSSPQDVTLDPSRSLFVADSLNARIVKFGPGGFPISSWEPFDGASPGPLMLPFLQGVAAGPDGSVYGVMLAPPSGGPLQGQHVFKLAPDGRLVRGWGRLGDGAGEFDRPRDIAVDSMGYVYVVDSWNHRVQKFDAAGDFVVEWPGWGVGVPDDPDKAFRYPWGVAVDPTGNVFVADTNNHRVVMFRSSGRFVTEWGPDPAGGPSLFAWPWAVAADSHGNVFVTDFRHRIQQFTFSPLASVAGVSAMVEAAAVPDGTRVAFLAKLSAATSLLEDDNPKNDVAARGALQAFVRMVEAERDKQISVDLADGLLAVARAALALMGE